MAVSQGFDDLLHQAHRLRADMEMEDEFPRVERNLFQIRDAAFKMATKTPSFNAEGTDIKASLLLGSRGYDVSKSTQKLESLNRAKTFEPLEPIKDVDIQAFLKNEYENAILTAVEHTRKDTFEEASRVHWEMNEREWEKEKKKLLNSLVDLADENFDFSIDQGNAENQSIIYGGTLNKSIIDPHNNATICQDTNTLFGDMIRQFNESSMKADSKGYLVNAIKKIDEQNYQEVWSMLESISEIQVTTSSSSMYSSAFRSTAPYQTSLIRQSLSHLEKCNMKHIDRMVSTNLQYAQRGGVPGTYNLIRSYFNIKFNAQNMGAIWEDGLVDGHPVWAMVYYCLRSGDNDAINQVVAKSRNQIGEFADFLLEYKSNNERRLSETSEREILLQYRRSMTSSMDPYKRLVYCLIGRCDFDYDHPDVPMTTDDFLWFKLSQVIVGVDNDGSSNNVLTLSQLQTILYESLGENHFNAHQDPLLYFRILMLVGLYEPAVEFLSRFDAYRDVSIHVGIVLFVSNLLLLPHNLHAHILTKEQSDTPPTRRLNFVRLIMTYVSRFERRDPVKAVHYYYLFKDLSNSEGENLFMSCVCEVVVNTREFDLLLGQLQLDGTRRPGLLDKLNVEVSKVIEKVALELENLGQLNDAVILYDLGRNQGKVVELLIKLLSQVISSPSKQQNNSLKKIAISVAERYSQQTTTIPKLPTFHLLLDLLTFFDYYHGNDMEDAYNVIKDLKLLSLSDDTLEDRLKNVSRMADEVRRCLPNILLATAAIITQMYKRVGSSTSASKFGSSVVADPTTNNLLRQYRSELHCLVSFCGSMPYRMPADVTARLVQFEASIK